MSQCICPKCKKESFNWTEDEDRITHWYCHECKYLAFEDQYMELECPDCGEKGRTRLRDDQTIYWWCPSCNRITYDV